MYLTKHRAPALPEPRKERMGGDNGPEVEVTPPAEVASFVLPIMAGSVQQLAPLELAAPAAVYSGSLRLIARRYAARGGTRLWRRGADQKVLRGFRTYDEYWYDQANHLAAERCRPQGSPANMVESEQLLVLTPASGGDPVVASFVQVPALLAPVSAWQRPAARGRRALRRRCAAASRCCGARCPTSSTSRPPASRRRRRPSPHSTGTRATCWTPTRRGVAAPAGCLPFGNACTRPN